MATFSLTHAVHVAHDGPEQVMEVQALRAA